MRQRQPRMQWKEWHLDRKTGEQRQKDKQLPMRRQRMVRQAARQRRDRKPQRVLAIVLIVPQHDCQQTEKGEQAAGQREQEKLNCRVPPLFVSPNANQEEKRDQRKFEENVKQDDIAGGEHAEAAKLQQKQHGIEQRRAIVDRF